MEIFCFHFIVKLLAGFDPNISELVCPLSSKKVKRFARFNDGARRRKEKPVVHAFIKCETIS